MDVFAGDGLRPRSMVALLVAAACVLEAHSAASARTPSGPVIEGARSRGFRTALREAWNDPVDFAGHYVMFEAGCGAECVMLAAIDRRTGRVVWFPWTICCWPDGVTEPVSWSRDSRVVTVVGLLDERGPRIRRRYVLEGGRFVPLRAADARGR